MDFRCLGWTIAIAAVIPLCFLPSLLCQLHYTPGRREALRKHYRGMKRPGKRLIHIIFIAATLTLADLALMFNFGFIHWSK
jgi:hypothetical protein